MVNTNHNWVVTLLGWSYVAQLTSWGVWIVLALLCVMPLTWLWRALDTTENFTNAA